MEKSKTMSKLNVLVATLAHAKSIKECTNDAFMADAFFKKPEYAIRFTDEDVGNLLKAQNAVFLIAVNGNDVRPSDPVQEVLGSIYLHWEWDAPHETLTGKFSAVSVPSKNGRRGIGKFLVQSAEAHLLSICVDNVNARVVMEMGVINVRGDLFPWYESQGYVVVGEIRPNDEEVTRIIRDDMDVCCVLMRKCLAIGPSS